MGEGSLQVGWEKGSRREAEEAVPVVLVPLGKLESLGMNSQWLWPNAQRRAM